MNRTVRLLKLHPAYQAWCLLWPDVKHAIENGAELEVEVRPVKRSLDQSAKLHAEIDEVAARIEWAGKKREPEVWKRLLTAAWLRARGESVEILPALDGHGVDVVFRRTSQLTKAECSELLEFVMAWKAEQGMYAES